MRRVFGRALTALLLVLTPVVRSDPHRFDGDRDGVGCET